MHGSYLYWDQFIVTTATFGEGSGGQGWIEDGPWFAYLGPPGFPDDITDGVRLGRLTLGRIHGSAPTARLEFHVPRVPTGKYFLRVCNETCTKGLGDIVGAGVTIARTETPAKLLQRLDRAHTNIANRIDRTAATMRERVDAAISKMRTETQVALDRVLADQRRLARLPADESQPATLLLLVPTAFVLGAMATWVAGRGARREDSRTERREQGRSAPAP